MSLSHPEWAVRVGADNACMHPAPALKRYKRACQAAVLRASCWRLALWGGTNSDNGSCRDLSRWQLVEQNKILAGMLPE